MQDKLLLAVSGGPDSMFMLDKYKHRNIVVAFVNYNKRKDSWKDEEIVTEFCKKYNITMHVFKLPDDFTYDGNFQALAREERYDFFKALYDKYNCTKLLIAHHKDDWLETAIMQRASKRKILYYGIKQKNVIQGMNIYRPFLFKYWKHEIEEILNSKEIRYAVDYTNALDIYTRNKIRNKLKMFNDEQKQAQINIFQMFNRQLASINKKVKQEIQFWKENNFNCDKEILAKIKHHQNVLFELLHNNFENLNLSSNKLVSIWQFINSENRTSKYLLKKGVFLYKNKNKLILNLK